LEAFVRRLGKANLRPRSGSLGIILVDEARMRALNRQFRGKERATDVLSFNLSDDAQVFEGEVYICPATARRRAVRRGLPFSEELARLVVHGVLHLAGYDHHTPVDGRRMAAATRRWLARWSSEFQPGLT